MATSQEYERSIINALAVSDVNMNTGLGTPVRKIISAVAGEMAQYAVDVNTTQTLYALDAVSGTELDYLVGQFGFTRQEAKAARGTVTIKRDNGDEVLQIAYGSQFTKPATATSPAVQFQTTAYQELDVGVLSAEIAIIAITPGLLGNVPAETITHTGAYSTYITVTNEKPTVGGRDAETDADLRTRFLNTVFRNVSGTRDQYIGLANAHEDVSRVNIIGQECHYTEIVQAILNNSSYQVHPTESTVAMDVAEAIDLDKRLWVRKTDSNELIEKTLYSVDTSATPFVITFGGETVEQALHIQFNGQDTCEYPLSYTPILAGSMSIVYQETLEPVSNESYTVDTAENSVTFTDAELDDAYVILTYKQVPVSAGDYVTIEFDYRSSHNRGGSKTVDVFVDGEAAQLVSDIQFLDIEKLINQDNAANWFRRNGSSLDSTAYGHLYCMLSRQPLVVSTGTINVGTSTILKEGTHFNVLYDATTNAGSTRGIDAIELIGSVQEMSGVDVFVFDADSGALSLNDGTPMSIPYYYNGDIGTIQSLLESQSVMTMDTLVHGPKKRLFSIPLDIMYSARPKNNVSSAIVDAIEKWVASLPFGAMVQISDIETVVANVVGVDNVKLNSDQSAGGIREYALDGITEVGMVHFTDFKLAQDELFELRDVVINDRSQQNW